jgi:hypothetical protein
MSNRRVGENAQPSNGAARTQWGGSRKGVVRSIGEDNVGLDNYGLRRICPDWRKDRRTQQGTERFSRNQDDPPDFEAELPNWLCAFSASSQAVIASAINNNATDWRDRFSTS